MNEPTSNASTLDLSSKMDSILLGLKGLYVAILLILSLPNFFLTLQAVRLGPILNQAMPGRPLPYLTVILIHSWSFLMLLTLIWPIVGILSVMKGKKPHPWFRIVSIIGVIVFQILITGLGICGAMLALTMNQQAFTQ